jgi:hypothetical protein
MMIVFANSSIAIFSYTPPSVAGTVGAVFNCALQLGSAVGLAAVSSIQTSVDVKNAASLSVPLEEFSQHLGEISQSTWRTAYQGRAASFWFLLGILVLEVIAVVVFFKVDMPIHDEEPKVSEKTDVEAAQKH